MSNVVFVPLYPQQKILFNTKEAYKRIDLFLDDASKTVYNKKPNSEAECIKLLMSVCNKHYIPLAKKNLKSDKPKNSNTGYILYCNAKRPEVKDKNPQMLPHEITQEIGRMWKMLTNNEKDEWHKKV